MLRILTCLTVVALTIDSLLSGTSRSDAVRSFEQHAARVDSVVLERSSCDGSCPSYRLMIDTADNVHYTSLTPGDTGKRFIGPALPLTNAKLLQMARRIHFAELPDTIAASPLCGPRVTDEQTVIVAIYGEALRKKVVHYWGCVWSPGALFDFENAVDSLANFRTWLRTADSAQAHRP